MHLRAGSMDVFQLSLYNRIRTKRSRQQLAKVKVDIDSILSVTSLQSLVNDLFVVLDDEEGSMKDHVSRTCRASVASHPPVTNSRLVSSLTVYYCCGLVADVNQLQSMLRLTTITTVAITTTKDIKY